MNGRLADLMRQATRLTQGGRLDAATQALQQALAQRPPTVEALAPQPLVWRDGAFEPDATEAAAPPTESDRFEAGLHRHGGLTRAYKLYVPPGAGTRPLPLVVMLHGCTQDPDDFAAGTGMNALARVGEVFVLYPAQSAEANPQRCWNWFKHNHQRRGSGEPGLIADLTNKLVRDHRIDAARVFVAGLSAGGAMAAIVAATHPEVYAALGVHSGLPQGAAQDLPAALAAMRQGAAAAAPLVAATPTIVFHGDLDGTVHPRNGELVIAAALGAAGGSAAQRQAGVAAGGRRYTRTCYGGDGAAATAEHWLLHGGGHAWSGGRAGGSYTDASGPDASAEMLRFFLERSPRR